MRAWVDLVATLGGEGHLWDKGFQFGDWLDPSAPPDKPGAGRTDPHVVATAYFAHSAELLGRAAGVLGRAEEEARYLRLAAQVRDAFEAEYVTPAGRVLSDSATAYVLALQFGLLRGAEQHRHAGERLAALVRESGYHISTGFVGTPLVCDALCSIGEYEAAYRLLTQRDCPSWLYPVTMGATTIWERWDSLRPDGSVNPGEMTSFNHYALGAVADWLHRTVGRPTLSLDSTLDELIDDPEAWSAVLTTMRQHMPELASYMERGVGTKGHDATTLRQMLSLLPGADELSPALEGALAGLGRQGG